MTAPVTNVRVECPRCGTGYNDWYRGSLNLSLDDFDAAYIRQATTATCPECGHVVEFDSLVVEGDVFTFTGEEERRTGPRDMERDPEDPSFPQPRRPDSLVVEGTCGRTQHREISWLG